MGISNEVVKLNIIWPSTGSESRARYVKDLDWPLIFPHKIWYTIDSSITVINEELIIVRDCQSYFWRKVNLK